MYSGCKPEQLLSEVEGLGVEGVLVEPIPPRPGEGWWPYPLDAWPLLNLARLLNPRLTGRIPVAKPKTVEDVARLVAWARGRGVCLVPRGGGSGVLGAAHPRDCCLVVDVSRLDWVDVNASGSAAYAGAGATLERVEQEARRYNLTLALEPQSFHIATVGGFINTLGSGLVQPGYGNIEDSILYIDAVLGTGDLVRLGSDRAPRGLQPYGLEHLLLGAEGGLGVVLGAGLRLRKVPVYVESRTFQVPDVLAGLEAAKRLVQWNQPAFLRLIDEREAQTLFQAQGPLLLAAYWDDEDVRVVEALASKAERVVSSLGGVRVEDVFSSWYEKRYSYGGMIELLAQAGLWFDTIDLQADWPTLARLASGLGEALDGADGLAAWFYHVSHFYPNGGSLYLTLAVEQDPVKLAGLWRRVMGLVEKVGGGASHHHGLGLQKLAWHKATPGSGSIKVYCLVKRALDPDDILVPYGVASLCKTGAR